MPLIRAGQEIFDRLSERYDIVACAPDSVPGGPPDYDGLIVGWGAYTHIPTRVRRVAFLQALKQRSVSGSPLMLSFFTRDDASLSNTILDRTAIAVRFVLQVRK